MKSLGIIRRMDDLGRVSIPKEIRREYGWPDGQPMEMFMQENQLVLKPYQDDEEKVEVLDTLKEAKQILQNTENEETRANMEQAIKKLEMWL